MVALATEMSEMLLFSVIDSVDLLFLFWTKQNERKNEKKQKNKNGYVTKLSTGTLKRVSGRLR